MSKSLLDRFLSRAVKQGRLGIVFADGSASTYGASAEGFPEIVLRFTDNAVPRDIVLDPRLGAAEAFIDGRLLIEEGDVMGLVGLLRMNGPWERGNDNLRPGVLKRFINTAAFAAEQINNRVGSKKNVAHHYDIGNDLYALMLDAEHWQYSCGYWPEGVTTNTDYARFLIWAAREHDLWVPTPTDLEAQHNVNTELVSISTWITPSTRKHVTKDILGRIRTRTTREIAGIPA